MNRPMPIPPKALAQLVQRAKTLDGCVLVSDGQPRIVEFAQHGTVIRLIGDDDYATGYQQRNPQRAAEIRKLLQERNQ